MRKVSAILQTSLVMATAERINHSNPREGKIFLVFQGRGVVSYASHSFTECCVYDTHTTRHYTRVTEPTCKLYKRGSTRPQHFQSIEILKNKVFFFQLKNKFTSVNESGPFSDWFGPLLTNTVDPTVLYSSFYMRDLTSKHVA